MRTFDENLAAYHRLNALNDLFLNGQMAKFERASTLEEMEAIAQEGDTHWAEQERLYKELGEEMAKIMDKKWWQFWK